jgi:hypothetical protein
MGAKLMPLVSAVDGRVSAIRTDSSGTAGNYVRVTDAQGWHYYYMHVNNDTPGTDDGRNPAAWRFASGIVLDATVYAGQLLGYLGDSGNAEGTSPHLHFEIRDPSGTPINAFESLQRADRSPAGPRLFVNNLLKSSVSASAQWALPGATVLACDIDGDGDDEPVQYLDRTFSWRNSVTASGIAGAVTYGAKGDLPVCGDWDGDGRDGIGVVRGTMWHLQNAFQSGTAALSIDHGHVGAPMPGDWDGDGDDDPGVLAGNRWTLRRGATVTAVSFGSHGDKGLTGDWNRDGTDDIGVRRSNVQHLRTATSRGVSVGSFSFGRTSDVAVAGDFDHDGDDTISVWRANP